MPEESVESKEKEIAGSTRVRLLFHGTNAETQENIDVRKGFIAEYGLLANKHTLTQSIETALVYAKGGFCLLTFWYPAKNEVQKISVGSTLPSNPIPDKSREEIRDRIKKSDLHDFYKQEYLRIVENTKTILPASRLGAIATLRYNHSSQYAEWFNMSSLSHKDDFLRKYTLALEDLIGDTQKVLDSGDVKFFDPSLNSRKLAEDINRTELEHYLSKIGLNLRYAQHDAQKKAKPFQPKERTDAELAKELEKLREVRFVEPLYERYRSILVLRIETYLRK